MTLVNSICVVGCSAWIPVAIFIWSAYRFLSSMIPNATVDMVSVQLSVGSRQTTTKPERYETTMVSDAHWFWVRKQGKGACSLPASCCPCVSGATVAAGQAQLGCWPKLQTVSPPGWNSRWLQLLLASQLENQRSSKRRVRMAMQLYMIQPLTLVKAFIVFKTHEEGKILLDNYPFFKS